jgi:deoxyadenosine/deoxycytidine kinase
MTGIYILQHNFAVAEIMAQKNTIKHIAVAGNIGSGKTTLTTKLAKHFKWEPHFEDIDHNPYLVDFYEDMHRWSFNLQVYFLNNRLQQLLDIRNGKKSVIQDRTIFEDAYIFAPNLYEMGLMTKRDFENYSSLFSTLKKLVNPPDLLIYLKASIPTIVDQIQKRGREYEENIRLDYLKRLNEFYNKWIEKYNDGPLLVIDVDKNNFAENDEDFAEVVRRIDAQINGLF